MPQATEETKAPAAAPVPEKPSVPQAALDHGGPDQAKPDEKGYPVGIPGDELAYAERKVPDGQPPAWPINEKLKVVRKDTPRLDGRAKVTGAAKYTADINLPGMLFARMLTSPHPHAKIKR